MVQKRAKFVALTYCVEHISFEVGKILEYVNLGTRNRNGVYIYQGTEHIPRSDVSLGRSSRKGTGSFEILWMLAQCPLSRPNG